MDIKAITSSFLTSPIVEIAIGKDESSQTILTAHQTLLIESPFLSEFVNKFEASGPVSIATQLYPASGNSTIYLLHLLTVSAPNHPPRRKRRSIRLFPSIPIHPRLHRNTNTPHRIHRPNQIRQHRRSPPPPRARLHPSRKARHAFPQTSSTYQNPPSQRYT